MSRFHDSRAASGKRLDQSPVTVAIAPGPVVMVTLADAPPNDEI